MVFSEEYLEVEEWSSLITSPNFHKLTDSLKQRIEKLNRDEEKLTQESSFDNSFKLNATLNRRAELKTLLKKFNTFLERKRQLDLESNKGE